MKYSMLLSFSLVSYNLINFPVRNAHSYAVCSPQTTNASNQITYVIPVNLINDSLHYVPCIWRRRRLIQLKRCVLTINWPGGS